MSQRSYEPLPITRDQAMHLRPPDTITINGEEWTIDSQVITIGWGESVTVVAVREGDRFARYESIYPADE